MASRHSTISRREAEAAVDLLRSQGYQADADPDTDSDVVVVLERDSVEALERLLRRAPSAQRLID